MFTILKTQAAQTTGLPAFLRSLWVSTIWWSNPIPEIRSYVPKMLSPAFSESENAISKTP